MLPHASTNDFARNLLPLVLCNDSEVSMIAPIGCTMQFDSRQWLIIDMPTKDQRH
jgi:hypothetical protein